MKGAKKPLYTQGVETVNTVWMVRWMMRNTVGVSVWHSDIPLTPHTFAGSEQSSLDAVM